MNIIFFALSANMLLNLDKLLISKINIIWIVTNMSLYNELLSLGINKNRIKLISIKGGIKYKFLNFFFGKKIALKNKMQSNINKLNKEFKPIFYLTDTNTNLYNIDTRCPKATVLHALSYKMHFLNPINLKYDFIFLPSPYIKNRIKKCYNRFKFAENQLEVIGDLKLSPFINNQSLNNNDKKALLQNYNLNENWTTVLYAPTWNAFENDKIFPDAFNGQFEKLEELANFLEENKMNLIIKFHYYMANFTKNIFIQKIKTKKNTSIFPTKKHFDKIEDGSDKVLLASDIVIGETSGILSTAIYLNKKMIFIEPKKNFNWDKSDIEKDLRPGYICNTFEDLKLSIIKYMKSDDFSNERLNFTKKIFYNKDIDAYIKLKESIISKIDKYL